MVSNSIAWDEPGEGGTSKEARNRGDHPRVVPAVDQATRLLFALANTARGNASLTELARETAIGKSQALAVLNTLAGAGLVTRDEQTKNYALGPSVVLLHRAFIASSDLGQSVTPYLQKLAAQTGCCVFVGLVTGETLSIIALRWAPSSNYVPLDVGHRLPLTWGAHGRAYLASLSPEELEERLANDAIIQLTSTDRDGVDQDTLRLQVDECRRLGYGKVIGKTWTALSSVSAVLWAGQPGVPEGRRVAGCLVAVGSFPADRVHALGRLLVDTTAEMSEQLGPLLGAVTPDFPLSASGYAVWPADNDVTKKG